MSAVSELIREGPGYKKAVLAAAVTAGVGACVYFGYRCATRSKRPASGASKPEEKKKHQPKAKEPVIKEEEHLLSKPEATKVDPTKISPVLHADELTSSGTFEKISLAQTEPENFEHLTMSQVNPVESIHGKKAKDDTLEGDLSSSTTSFLQAEREDDASVSILNQPESFENLYMSQTEPSVSFSSSTGQKKDPVRTKEPQMHFGGGALDVPERSPSTAAVASEEAAASKDDESKLLTIGSGVKVKDENDIVVVEPSSEESGSEKSEEERLPRSGMASADIDFDASLISPVFGHQTYQQVSTEPNELESFDPAKVHPASFGFVFDKNV